MFKLSPSLALILGLAFGLFFRNPYPAPTQLFSKYLLQAAIVGLGFGMDFGKILEAGKSGFLFTVISLAVALAIGYLLGRWLKVDRRIAYLISVGTAICGGSAIAAVSQVLKSDEKEISVSIGTVFILNAVALLVFPQIGSWLHFTQEQFGVWAAVAIHDTSSVVGAASHYGNEALMIATTVKMARTLWIIPMVVLTGFLFHEKGGRRSYPWFIALFVLASLVNTFATVPQALTHGVVSAAKVAFSITLYFIGTGLSVDVLRKVGVRPLLQGVLLWLLVSIVSLVAIQG